MTRFLSAGYVDSFRTLCPEKQEYTWWSYRFNSRAKNKGWRIDYCMVSEPVRPLLKRAYILNECRTFRPLSDGSGNIIEW